MKKLTKILTLLMILGIAAESKAQSGGFGPDMRWYSTIYSGSSHPIGEFIDFATTGLDLGMSFDYKVSKVWGIGLDINHQRNNFEMPSRFSPIESTKDVNYTLRAESQGKWTSTSFGFGPWWLIQPGGPSGDDGFFIKIYANSGVSFVKSPEASISLSQGEWSGDLFAMKEQSKVAVNFRTGAQFNFKLKKNLTFFVNPQYVYTSAKVNYSYKDLTYANSTGEFNPQVALFDTETTKKSINPSYFNLNVGLSYGFGPVDKGFNRRK